MPRFVTFLWAAKNAAQERTNRPHGVFLAAWTGCSARAYRHRCDLPVRRAARSAWRRVVLLARVRVRAPGNRAWLLPCRRRGAYQRYPGSITSVIGPGVIRTPRITIGR